MKNFREEMTQKAQLFKYLIKANSLVKTNLQGYICPVFFFFFFPQDSFGISFLYFLLSFLSNYFYIQIWNAQI